MSRNVQEALADGCEHATADGVRWKLACVVSTERVHACQHLVLPFRSEVHRRGIEVQPILRLVQRRRSLVREVCVQVHARRSLVHVRRLLVHVFPVLSTWCLVLGPSACYANCQRPPTITVTPVRTLIGRAGYPNAASYFEFARFSTLIYHLSRGCTR